MPSRYAGVVLTNPVDVIKVRQQLAGPASRNLAATGWGIVRHEGVAALWQGVTPAVARGVVYGGAQQGARRGRGPRG
jgi:solute carrier family 25 uncoupling protein 8/9